ncbi:hypothetical protein BOTBODRAFT_121837 [Botryobasidium botryosum FD-172 SS1]|uniref:SUN domain-containing protein n=1 Tax=Botryobasidium botryosum (strain FD-172 SS1) TaxID=930990 RepID=A0A067M2P4_BOTB1|nr:hypothetical protein BOTBODRAFT_121837 [Botryobasidium botryosum FD-172 SS1]
MLKTCAVYEPLLDLSACALASVRGLTSTSLPSRHNFALSTHGASIIQAATTQSYGHAPPINSAFLDFVYVLFPRGVAAPELILQPSNSFPSCWSFAGTKGQVGIQLERKIFIKEVVMHVPNAGLASVMPRRIHIWGLTKRADDEESKAAISDTPTTYAGLAIPGMAPTLLARFEFSRDSSLATQSFSVKTEPHHSYSAIVVEVRSNWGDPRYTCLPRLQVHGIPEESAKER